MNKRKIINDPVFGFIHIPNELIYQLIEHPYVQRLTRIRQMGLAFFVYPGAQHTRFHHSIGAMYLMDQTIKQLRAKGVEISSEEAEAALACILLHDIGHSPFSHVLENTLVANISHEEISLLLMNRINDETQGGLHTCIKIFQDHYPRHFFHRLVSGQLDMDRLDYLCRDSFFTGVVEGNIGSERILKMLHVHNDRLVVEEKGIYSIENFLMARRLMFWQVYLHKTAVAADNMLINILLRAKELAQRGVQLFASPALHYFLYHTIDRIPFHHDSVALQHFVDLDDTDIWSALKVWAYHSDKVLSMLSAGMINRNLFKIDISTNPFDQEMIDLKINQYIHHFQMTEEEASYLVSSNEISTDMYNESDDSIDILFKNGTIQDISQASDMLNIQLLSKKVKKYCFCYWKIG